MRLQHVTTFTKHGCADTPGQNDVSRMVAQNSKRCFKLIWRDVESKQCRLLHTTPLQMESANACTWQFNNSFISTQISTRLKLSNRPDKENLWCANQKRRCFDYQPGQEVLVSRHGILLKRDKRFDGPFQITKVHINGNVTIKRSPYIFERIKIKRTEL